MILRDVPFLWGRATQDKEWKEACAEVQSLVDRYIDRALSEKVEIQEKSSPWHASNMFDTTISNQERPFPVLYELIEETQDRRFIRNQLISLFFLARDVNAIAISDLFFHLAQNPQVRTKLRAEILHHDQDLAFESLKSMKYLQAVLNESKRAQRPYPPSYFRNSYITSSQVCASSHPHLSASAHAQMTASSLAAAVP